MHLGVKTENGKQVCGMCGFVFEDWSYKLGRDKDGKRCLVLLNPTNNNKQQISEKQGNHV